MKIFKHTAIIPVLFSLTFITSCDKTSKSNQNISTIRFLSFDKYVESATPQKKDFELFTGNKLTGSAMSIGKRPQAFSVFPSDEVFIYAVKETTLVDIDKGTNELKPGEALFLPAKTMFRLSSKNEKFESKIIIVRSNQGKIEYISDLK